MAKKRNKDRRESRSYTKRDCATSQTINEQSRTEATPSGRSSKEIHVIQFKNSLSEDERAEVLKNGAADYPIVCSEISAFVQEAIGIVRIVDPLSLLRRGYWEYANACVEAGPEESSVGPKQIVSRMMIDYVQRLVCAVGPEDAPEATETQYQVLRNCVEQIYERLSLRFLLARTALLQGNVGYDRSLDEFRVLAEGTWSFVAGDRHQYYQVRHLRELLVEQDDLLKQCFGIDASCIAHGVEKLQWSLTFGLSSAIAVVKKGHDAFNALCDADPSRSVEDIMVGMRSDGDLSHAMECVFGCALFDVAAITQWPSAFVKALSATPGSDSEYVRHPERGGWPTQNSIVQDRPFVEIQGKSYVFDETHALDVLYRAIEKAVLAIKPSLRTEWSERQQRASEQVALSLLQKLLPGAVVHRNVQYEYASSEQGQVFRAECDGVILYDNHLLVVEVKGGALTRKSPAVEQLPLIDSLKKLITAPADQGLRLLHTLSSQGEINLFDSKRRRVCVLSGVYSSKVAICVTLDQVTHFSSNVEHIEKVVQSKKSSPFWTVSIDDLRVIADLVPNAIEFLHFIQERLAAFGSSNVRAYCELDHLCAYWQHNRYSNLSCAGSQIVGWLGYQDDVDRYYSALMKSEVDAVKPRKQIPPLIAEVVHALASGQCPGRVLAGKYLLDGDTASLDELTVAARDAMDRQLQLGRVLPISTAGDFRVTLVCCQQSVAHMDWNMARLHAVAVLQLQSEEDRLLLVADFDSSGNLKDVVAERITKKTALEIGEDTIRPVRQRLFRQRYRRR